MAVSSQMNGANQVWQLGYTGAGTRIAVIDTGLMLDHETFDPGAFDYAIAEDAQKAQAPDWCQPGSYGWRPRRILPSTSR